MSVFTFVILLVICSISLGFRVSTKSTVTKLPSTSRLPSLVRLQMADSEKGSYELVPLDKTNIQNAASFTGGLLGLVLFGPIGAALLAATVNYVSKKDNDAGEALRGLGKTVVESVNFFKKVDSKYELTDKIVDTVTTSVSNIKTEPGTLDTVKSTVSSVVSKVKELNEEYDLVSKGKEVIGIAGTLSDAALEKVDELNQKVTNCNFLFSFIRA